ncbi:PREDICTED: cytochrome P450 4C1-like [Dinoponera quadriceps]|uniref:Cytochrome P450 4C1-like n=1 Tax=Dinoponera quadriceps TaxID=609295 RepID=A0A6P3YBI9_DINQU|nr:PREDICTED: cytochrome P450 4C1-like [Dinoponera quadriceps]
MGISLQGAGSFQQKYHQTVYDMGKIVINRVFKPWLLNDTIFSLTSLGRIYNKYLNILHSFTEKII